MHIINKVFSCFAVCLLCVLSFNPLLARAQEVETVLYNSCAITGNVPMGSHVLTQTFSPGVDRISDVGVHLRNASFNAAKMRLTLTGPNGLVINKADSIPGNSSPYRYVRPVSEIVAQPDGVYALWIYPYAGYEDNVISAFASGVGNNNCISSGTGWDNLVNLNRDLQIVVFGYNTDDSEPEVITQESETPPSNQDLTEVAEQPVSDDSVAPSTASLDETSNAPANLEGVYNPGTKAVDLNWDASDLKDITAYEVYRTIQGSSEFSKIGDTGAEILTYSDSNIQFGEQYVYYIVAVAGDEKSDSSNIVSINITDESLKAAASVAGEKTFLEKKIDFLLNNWWVPWALGALALALLLLLIILIRRRKQKKNRQMIK